MIENCGSVSKETRGIIFRFIVEPGFFPGYGWW